MEGILSQLLSGIFLFFITLIVLLIGGFAVSFFIRKSQFEAKLGERLRRKDDLLFLLIKVSPSNAQKEDAMEDFLRSLHRVLPKNTTISLEMVSNNQFLHFYIVVPKEYKNIIESQLYAQYSEAEIEEARDYLDFVGKEVAYAQVKMKRPSMRPLNTYKDLEENLLKNLSAVLSKTSPKEGVVMQLILRKVGSGMFDRGFRAAQLKYFGSKETPAGGKMGTDIFMGKLRFLYIADNKAVAKSKLNTLLPLLKIVKSGHNEFKKESLGFTKDIHKHYLARISQSADMFTPAEAATLYHFPYSGTIISNVVNTTSKRAPAPDILPREGIVNPKDVSFIGETNYRNEKNKFGLKRVDRRRHLYVVGKTGSGKSRLLQLLLVADIQSGQGCCVLDPHGDLAIDVLRYVPKERIQDVVYVNPADRDFPIGFNPLEPVDDYEVRQHLSRFFIAIFKKLFAESWNPRMEHLIRYITLALLETEDSNILGIPRMLSDTNYRQRVIKQIQDPVVKSFWTNEFSASNEQFMDAAAIPIMNKVGQFIANPVIRNMVGQQKNALDFERFMNEGKIVIINASKGKLGEENSALLGSMFITKIQQGALNRAKIPEDERRDFYFYVDEFQNFATDAFSSILSEARKYRLDLTIAHQYIAQLPDDVKATAFGNVGTIISFAIGGDDAAYLAKEFSPVFSPDDMINLNTREMYIKMSIDGRLAPPFSARTLDVPRSTFDYTEEIMENSRRLYGRDRSEVEQEIEKWSRADTLNMSQQGPLTQENQPLGNSSDDESDGGFPEPII